ncbi:MAG TPA: hypothetical protein EYQ02_05385 [Microbacterium sp.]|nr:hypothetical protein [Microbacterium sp.]
MLRGRQPTSRPISNRPRSSSKSSSKRTAAGRDAMNLIAGRVSAYDLFFGAQSRGIALGVIYSPEEVMEDRHFIDRGFPTEVEHEDIGRTITYPGAPYKFGKSPWRIQRRAPHLGEHNEQIFGSLGTTAAELTSLRADGVI